MPGRYPQPCDIPDSAACFITKHQQSRPGSPLVIRQGDSYIPGPNPNLTPDEKKQLQGFIDQGAFSPEDRSAIGDLGHFFEGVATPAAAAVGSAVVATGIGTAGEWLYANGYLASGPANKTPAWIQWVEKTIASTAASLGISKLFNKNKPASGSPPINVFSDRGPPAVTPADFLKDLLSGGSGSGGGSGGSGESSSLFTPLNIGIAIAALVVLILLSRR